jgi:hypothetical protein
MFFSINVTFTKLYARNYEPSILKIKPNTTRPQTSHFVYTASIKMIKSDPDWIRMATIQYNFLNAFVSSNVNLDNFNFNDTTAFLGVLGMSLSDYNSQVALNQSTARTLVSRYGFTGSCSACSLSESAGIDSLKTILKYFRANPNAFNLFQTESLGIGKSVSTCCCCGFWFYACCAVCAETIVAFPIYLACCALCFHAECCKP